MWRRTLLQIPTLFGRLAFIAGLRASGKPFVYTSGIWVNGDTGGKVIDESAPYNAAAIVAWRPAHERTVLDAAAQDIRFYFQ